jgi:hypothetical protein
MKIVSQAAFAVCKGIAWEILNSRENLSEVSEESQIFKKKIQNAVS